MAKTSRKGTLSRPVIVPHKDVSPVSICDRAVLRNFGQSEEHPDVIIVVCSHKMQMVKIGPKEELQCPMHRHASFYPRFTAFIKDGLPI